MCEYFILTKQNNIETNNDDKNQIITLTDKVYILPKNNIGYYIHNGLCEKNLIEWCKQFCSKDKNMLDIGAHSGTYTISLSNYCKHIYAFEPQKMTFYSLCGSVALSNIQNVTCINYGLGSLEQIGKQTLNIVSLDGGGSSLYCNNNNTILQKEEIEVRTLDSFDIDNIGFIKIDVEDNEYQVLFSSQNTLKKSNYPKILFEMNTENQQLLDFLKNLNYNIISITGCYNIFLAVNVSNE
jgi:FkbM family methyltransferase